MDERTVLEFEIRGLPHLNPSDRVNRWKARKDFKKWKEDTYLLAKAAIRFTAKPSRPQIYLARHSSKAPDPDNLAYSFKPVLDGLVQAGVIQDDSLNVIDFPVYSWHMTGPQTGKISVLVTDAPSDRITMLRRENEELRRENNKLRQENAELRKK